MADPTSEFFRDLGQRAYEPLLKRTSGTLRFDISEGKRTERWLVAITKGEVAVSRSNVRADCVVSIDRALFDDVVSGKTNAMAAMLRGALSVEGEVHLLVPFQRLFPGPRRSRSRRKGSAARAMRKP